MLTRKLLSKQSMYFSLFQRPLLSVALAFQSSFPWPVLWLLSAFLIALGPSKHYFPQIYRFYTQLFNLFNPSILGLVDIAITSSVPHWSQSLNQQIFLITPKSSLSFHPWPSFLYSPFLFLWIFFVVPRRLCPWPPAMDQEDPMVKSLARDTARLESPMKAIELKANEKVSDIRFRGNKLTWDSEPITHDLQIICSYLLKRRKKMQTVSWNAFFFIQSWNALIFFFFVHIFLFFFGFWHYPYFVPQLNLKT